MNSEIKVCQNCKKNFAIDPEDFAFYQKMQVPAPTWCPQCRMIRRFVWRNDRRLFRRTEVLNNKEIYSTFPPAAPVKIYDRSYWHSDSWDKMSYGRDYDFSRPFFLQLADLIGEMPLPSRSVSLDTIDADYVANVAQAKQAYLCFSGVNIINSAYVVGFTHVQDGFDLYQSRHSELCYDSYMVDEAQKVFYSVNIEDSHDVWFSRNLMGCTNCFGCMNLRNKSYYIFNKPVSKEEYKRFMSEFDSGSYKQAMAMRGKAQDFWLRNPNRYTLAINVVNSTGEHIEHTRNVKDGYFVHESENLTSCQIMEGAKDCADTLEGLGVSQVYESCTVTTQMNTIIGSYHCHGGCNNLFYSLFSAGSRDLFGCVGMRKKQYCILNKQYTKEEYEELLIKIRKHMDEMPYADAQGRVYRYGDFLPTEMSPFAYNDTCAQDFFPLAKEEALKRGYRWHDEDIREFQITKKASEFSDNIKEVVDDVTKEVIGCEQCGRGYRIVDMELQFYRRIPLPLPRLCVECRFRRRFSFANPPEFYSRPCECAGTKDDKGIYENNASHTHGESHCPEVVVSSYNPKKKEIIYCQSCYQAEVL